MQILNRIKQAVLEQKYRISAHANEEMSDDSLEASDIENIVLTGNIVRKYTHDPRGTRYKIAGSAKSGLHSNVVCRFLSSGILLIITVFVEDRG